MRGVHKLITVLFFVGFLGVIITGYQNCGTQEAGNTLCFGSDCSRKDGSNGTPTYTPPPAGTQPNITVAMSNQPKLYVNIPAYCDPNPNLAYQNDPTLCSLNILWNVNTPSIIYVYHDTASGSVRQAFTGCQTTAGAQVANWIYLQQNGNYVFELYEFTSCPSNLSNAYSGKQPVATLAVRRL